MLRPQKHLSPWRPSQCNVFKVKILFAFIISIIHSPKVNFVRHPVLAFTFQWGKSQEYVLQHLQNVFCAGRFLYLTSGISVLRQKDKPTSELLAAQAIRLLDDVF